MIIGGLGFGKIIVVNNVGYELVVILENVVLFCFFRLLVMVNDVVILMIFICSKNYF